MPGTPVLPAGQERHREPSPPHRRGFAAARPPGTQFSCQGNRYLTGITGEAARSIVFVRISCVEPALIVTIWALMSLTSSANGRLAPTSPSDAALGGSSCRSA